MIEGGDIMLIIKRNVTESTFFGDKIYEAISKANLTVSSNNRLSKEQIEQITKNVVTACEQSNHTLNVEEVQDLVENELMKCNAFEVARNYITYRYKRAEKRAGNTTDDYILSLIECNNEEILQENSNKNPIICSVQRDYMAGEVSKDLTRRVFLPQRITDAHDKALIHFHDADYFAQHIHNCDLVNLEDMLQNGTVISGTMIEKPHKFSTACNIATQIIAQVASSQYGGQSISLTHLAPFVEETRKTLRKKYPNFSEEVIEQLTKDDVRAGVQTIQYQVVTLMTTNGHAPFITVFMYLNEV